MGGETVKKWGAGPAVRIKEGLLVTVGCNRVALIPTANTKEAFTYVPGSEFKLLYIY